MAPYLAVDPIVRKLVPGARLFDDKADNFAPVVPRDLAKREAANADGTAKCEMCRETFALAELDVTAYGYRCAACAKQAQPAVDLTNVKVGRGRWWIMPIVIAVGGALTLWQPAIAIGFVVIGGLFTLRLFAR